MIFNEQHKVIINSLNEDESRAFVKFLESEIIRHEDDIQQTRDLISLVHDYLRISHDWNRRRR